jgi:hypothetical protein
VSDWVQTLLSVQGAPSGLAGLEHRPVAGLQMPASWHWSNAVQVSATFTHPLDGLQESVVQRLPSSQAALLAVWVQASVISSQASTVQDTPSSQLGAVPAWQPSVGLQVSVPLQALPSSHTTGV